MIDTEKILTFVLTFVLSVFILLFWLGWQARDWCLPDDIIIVRDKCGPDGWPVATRDTHGNLHITCSKVGQ